ncbi:MAG: DNA polymerase III subunit [Candidatus Kerfeldbacteria bacterium]|nr:DNA polymerase III subunit [Candidatus Kerfeldbacteria bacterium]
MSNIVFSALNNPAWQYFKLLFDNNNLGQAYLIYGMPGVGKAVLAERLLQLLFCQDTAGKPCGHCQNCRQVVGHSYQDMHWLEKLPDKQDITIQQIRELRDFVRTRSWQGEPRVVVINLADEMNTEAVNALLKMLEEPATGVIFLLLAVNLRKLPRTIISRCQLLPVGLAPKEQIVDLLKMSGVEFNLAQDLAQYADGRIGLAELWMNNDVTLRTHLQVVKELIELITINKWLAWQNFINRNLAKENSSSLNSIQPAALELLSTCQEIGRALLQLKLGLDNLVIYQKQQNELKLLAARWSWARLADWLKSLEAARSKILANGNVRLTFESLLAKLISYED